MHRIFGPDVAALASAECRTFGHLAVTGFRALQVLSGDFLFAHASGLIESLEDDEAACRMHAARSVLSRFRWDRTGGNPPGLPGDRRALARAERENGPGPPAPPAPRPPGPGLRRRSSERFGYGEMSQSAKRFDTQVSLFNYLKKQGSPATTKAHM